MVDRRPMILVSAHFAALNCRKASESNGSMNWKSWVLIRLFLMMKSQKSINLERGVKKPNKRIKPDVSSCPVFCLKENDAKSRPTCSAAYAGVSRLSGSRL